MERAEQEVARIVKKYSRYRPDSLLSAINYNAGVQHTIIDAETHALLEYADSCYQQSEGRFDITSGVLRQVWKFDKKQQLPTQQQVDVLLPLIGWSQISRSSNTIDLPQKGMEIDLGGIGKEYAADRVASLLQQAGITSAMVNMGGDIRILGPHPDGSPWSIGIPSHTQKQTGKPRVAATVPIYRGAIATSGDYERCMVVKGKTYSHILDPKSGWPVKDPFHSVSVIADYCLSAGSVATIAMLMGKKQGGAWLSSTELTHHTQ
ncbi:MAG: FAD:protein FMN transferase [Gammaproteobacteria bacterium]|nr:FAD:protein FMN transferase [Gammaproteobacteria bacterium]